MIKVKDFSLMEAFKLFDNKRLGYISYEDFKKTLGFLINNQ